MIERLKSAYHEDQACGIGWRTYLRMAGYCQGKVEKYLEYLAQPVEDGAQMYAKSIAFAKAFGICSEECQMMFDIMCHLERIEDRINNRNICVPFVNELNNVTYKKAHREFKNWSGNFFGPYVGLVKFLKFYYLLIKYIK